jgi:hypothetical protein
MSHFIFVKDWASGFSWGEVGPMLGYKRCLQTFQAGFGYLQKDANLDQQDVKIEWPKWN